MEKIIELTEEELEQVNGGSAGNGNWAYRIVATKEGYLDIRKVFTGYHSFEEARDAKDYMVGQLTDRGYHIHLTAVYQITE